MNTKNKPEVATGNQVGGSSTLVVEFETNWGWQRSHHGRATASTATEATAAPGAEQGPGWGDACISAARWDGSTLRASVGVDDPNGFGESLNFSVRAILPAGECPLRGTTVVLCPICGQRH